MTLDDILGRSQEYMRDLSKLGRGGLLDPPVARSREIEHVVRVLMRRARNNPVLVGESGVGKSKLFEAVAYVITDHDGPLSSSPLSECRLLGVDLGGLCKRVSDRTTLDNVLQQVFKAASDSRRPVILMLDDLHTILLLGVPLTPWLNRDGLRCVGATTPEKYRQCAQSDAELERFFEPVTVGEPTVDETALILRCQRDRLEAHHRMQIKDDAVDAAASLSARYLKGRALPAKAIELLDEACVRARLQMARRPVDLNEIDAAIEQLNLEKEAAVAEQDFEKAAHLRDQADKLKKKKQAIQRDWREMAKEIGDVVDEVHVFQAVAHATEIPVEQLRERLDQRDPEPASVPPTEVRQAHRGGTAELSESLGDDLPEFAEDVAALRQLLGVDTGSTFNKMRYITEKVLHRLCMRNRISWGEAEPTLERMIGPLLKAGVLPKSIGIHVRTIQANTSPGSHYQEDPLTDSHARIALSALAELLGWFKTIR